MDNWLWCHSHLDGDLEDWWLYHHSGLGRWLCQSLVQTRLCEEMLLRLGVGRALDWRRLWGLDQGENFLELLLLLLSVLHGLDPLMATVLFHVESHVAGLSELLAALLALVGFDVEMAHNVVSRVARFLEDFATDLALQRLVRPVGPVVEGHDLPEVVDDEAVLGAALVVLLDGLGSLPNHRFGVW